MTLSQLQMFLAVLAHRNFSKAALELEVSQAAVSYAIQQLERELGAKLLKRGRFGAQPTELGEQIAEHARRMLQDEQAIKQFALMAQGRIQGELRVAVFHTVLTSIMPVTLSTAALKYPELHIKLFEPHLHNALQRHSVLQLFDILHEGQASVVFFQYPFPEVDKATKDLFLWGLVEDSFVALVPRQLLPGSPSDELPLRLLREEALIFDTGVACGVMINEYLRQHADSVTARYDVQDDAAVLNLVTEGVGVGLLTRLAVDHLPDGVIMLPLAPPLIRTIGVAIRSDSFKIPAVRAFLDALRTQFPASNLPAFTRSQPAPHEVMSERS